MKTLLTWRTVHEKLPWGLFLLFGGGFALAEGCKVMNTIACKHRGLNRVDLGKTYAEHIYI